MFLINVTFKTLKCTIENIFLFYFSVSLGDFSDTSVDENSVNKKMNNFHISDDEENNSPKLSFLKTKKSSKDVRKHEPIVSIKNDDIAFDNGEGMVVNPLPESQNKQQEVEKEKIKMETKPRILPIKSTSSGNLLVWFGLVAKLCWTLCNPMDYSPPSSSVHGIFQARILEWIKSPSSGNLLGYCNCIS